MYAQIKDPIFRSIVEARVKLLFDFPFFGNLAARLKIVDATKWCPTAATDGRHLFYNREFIRSLTKNELHFLIAHEVLHCIFDHLGRRSGRIPMIWNAANDYLVNYTLVKERIGEMPKGGLYSDKYTDEMSSDEIYNAIMKKVGEDAAQGLTEENAKKMGLGTLDQHLACDGSDGDGNGSGGKDGNSDKINPFGPGGRNPDGDPDPGDETGVNYEDSPPVYTENELAKIRTELKAAVINSYQSNQGNTPGCIERLLQDLTEPKINWRELLACTIQACIKGDFTYRKISKKSWACNCILPSNENETTIDVAVSLDTSGSIGDDIFRSFLSEVKGILEQFQHFNLHIWCIDAAIYNHQIFTQDSLDDIDSYKPMGGGGNDFPLNWKFMREQEINPEIFVCFSDGYPCGSWGDPDYCDTIFVIKNDWDKNIEAPFGLTVYMED